MLAKYCGWDISVTEADNVDHDSRAILQTAQTDRRRFPLLRHVEIRADLESVTYSCLPHLDVPWFGARRQPKSSNVLWGYDTLEAAGQPSYFSIVFHEI